MGLVRSYNLFLHSDTHVLRLDYETRLHPAGRPLDGIRNMAEHTPRRKLWARGMNSAAMKYYEELILATAADLVNALEQRAGQRVDISDWMTYFSYETFSPVMQSLD